MKIKYNAPVTISFALICTVVLVVNNYMDPDLISNLFTAEGSVTFSFEKLQSYIRLITHVFGHRSIEHLLTNLMLILLLGPMLEEKHGSGNLMWMIFITALVNGLVNALFFPSPLVGSSGVAFMMIILISFANIREGEIPITFLLVLVLYLFQEIKQLYTDDNISQISHIVGGACGAVFGFLNNVRKKSQAPAPPPPMGGQTIMG